MLSRRNVRIKVMQVLYAMSRDNGMVYKDALASYRNNIQKSYELYLFSLWLLIQIAEYAKQDAAIKEAKLLPTEEDKRFTAKLAENEWINSLLHNEDFMRQVRLFKLSEKLDIDSIRLFYNDFAKTDEYKEFLDSQDSNSAVFQHVLLALYKHCNNNETFCDYLEDHYANWIDDKSLIVGAIKKTIKALPAESNFLNEYRPDAETVEEFGESLLAKVCENDQQLFELIEPTLRNWDAERVAVIDMILLKMALCELTNFPTIPTKVTLNEFVEISKLYSTDKSKDFINGILDRLMKKLETEGRINKEGRGLVE
ncbi:MAG TPA: transcription antitermination factor NusB [Saprospiraceae bacterium]|nr:transcription antitermination factor NusB [Saprospiraceae bacterium]HMQ84826.1 transcription antitermination factor NusB [Saprospiraceae bacterium]